MTIGGKVTTGGMVTTQPLVRSLAAEAIATGEPRTTDNALRNRCDKVPSVPSYFFLAKFSIAIKRVH